MGSRDQQLRQLRDVTSSSAVRISLIIYIYVCYKARTHFNLDSIYSNEVMMLLLSFFNHLRIMKLKSIIC